MEKNRFLATIAQHLSPSEINIVEQISDDFLQNSLTIDAGSFYDQCLCLLETSLYSIQDFRANLANRYSLVKEYQILIDTRRIEGENQMFLEELNLQTVVRSVFDHFSTLQAETDYDRLIHEVTKKCLDFYVVREDIEDKIAYAMDLVQFEKAKARKEYISGIKIVDVAYPNYSMTSKRFCREFFMDFMDAFSIRRTSIGLSDQEIQLLPDALGYAQSKCGSRLILELVRVFADHSIIESQKKKSHYQYPDSFYPKVTNKCIPLYRLGQKLGVFGVEPDYENDIFQDDTMTNKEMTDKIKEKLEAKSVNPKFDEILKKVNFNFEGVAMQRTI